MTSVSDILFLDAQLVGRSAYFGGDLIAKNSSSADTDHRGYPPVERWIASLVEAKNAIDVESEGLSVISREDPNSGGQFFKDVAEQMLGDYVNVWPLIKLLDIAGSPIPAHVHAGNVVDGQLQGHGKIEAYFFPPLIGAASGAAKVTHLGLKDGVTQKQLIDAVQQYGSSDLMYDYLVEHQVESMTGFHIPAGCVHAPGARPTLELQTPQDDFNMLAARLGQRLEEDQRRRDFECLCCKGLTPEQLISGAVDFKACPIHHKAQLKEKTDELARYQIFFGIFDAEWLEISGAVLLGEHKLPSAFFVWDGAGSLNQQHQLVRHSEFIVKAKTRLTIKPSADRPLQILRVFPMQTVQ